jgi:hypothetical protein
MIFQKQDPEKIKAAEKAKIDSLTNENTDVYEYLSNIREASRIMEKSKFKEIYRTEGIHEAVCSAIFSQINNKANKKESLDRLIEEGTDVFLPLKNVIPSCVTREEINFYCLASTLKPDLNLIGNILERMDSLYEQNICNPKVLVDFNTVYDKIWGIVADFNPPSFALDKNAEMKEFACRFGNKILGSMDKNGYVIAIKNRQKISYKDIEQLVEKYSKETGK